MGTWVCFIATLFIYLFDFVNIDLFVVSEKCYYLCVASAFSLKMMNDIRETHRLSVTV